MKKLAIGIGAAGVMLAACAEGPQNTTDDFGYDGTGIEFKVSPLTLDTLGDACYSFAVINGASELVVGRGPSVVAGNLSGITGTMPSGSALNAICASQFGNTAGGDISYVAPCDADQPAHSVRLWVNKLCQAGATGQDCAEIQSYVNPCPSTGCVLTPVTCVENADTPVTFNFTIMGQADQGFFDIAVNFEDVFCSAKFDTCNTLGDPIRLVFDAEGNRMATAVAAIACTSGMGAGNTTHLTVTSASFTCTGTNTVTGLPVAPGGSVNLQNFTSEGTGTFAGIRYARYFGTEAQADWNKVYTNIALGLEPGATCSFAWNVIASNGPFANPTAPDVYNSVPVVNFNITGVTAGTCIQRPLNGENGGVTTIYIGASSSLYIPGVLNSNLAEGNSTYGCYRPTSAWPDCIL